VRGTRRRRRHLRGGAGLLHTPIQLARQLAPHRRRTRAGADTRSFEQIQRQNLLAPASARAAELDRAAAISDYWNLPSEKTAADDACTEENTLIGSRWLTRGGVRRRALALIEFARPGTVRRCPRPVAAPTAAGIAPTAFTWCRTGGGRRRPRPRGVAPVRRLGGGVRSSTLFARRARRLALAHQSLSRSEVRRRSTRPACARFGTLPHAYTAARPPDSINQQRRRNRSIESSNHCRYVGVFVEAAG
jgi:hypothetical protein